LTFGSTGGDLATAAKIFGVEADTGKKLWEFATIEQDPESWPAESAKYGGAALGCRGSYDPETGLV